MSYNHYMYYVTHYVLCHTLCSDSKCTVFKILWKNMHICPTIIICIMSHTMYYVTHYVVTQNIQYSKFFGLHLSSRRHILIISWSHKTNTHVCYNQYLGPMIQILGPMKQTHMSAAINITACPPENECVT